VLAAVASDEELHDEVRLLRAITASRGGVYFLGVYPPGSADEVRQLPHYAQDLQNEGVFARDIEIEHPEFLAGTELCLQVLSPIVFRPNILLVRLNEARDAVVPELLELCLRVRTALCLYAPHPEKQLGDQGWVNVWVRDQGPDWQLGLRLSNLDLALLLAYQIALSWKGRFRLCMAVPDPETAARARTYLADLMTLGRLQAWGEALVVEGSFPDVIHQVPAADLTLLGLPREPNMAFLRDVIGTVDGSCLLVRDSGKESVLA